MSLADRIAIVPGVHIARRVLVAVDGTKVNDLARQASKAIAAGANLLTIQSGGNDICNARSPQRITSPQAFRASLDEALTVLRERAPNARIFITSITDEARWNDGSESIPGNDAKLADGTVCDPAVDGTGRQSAARRQQIQRWEQRFNMILSAACHTDAHCRYDGGAFFRLAYSPIDVAPADAFHPSIHGLRRFATLAWQKSFDFSDRVAPIVHGNTQPGDHGLILTLAGIDRGQPVETEYRIDQGFFTAYAAPVTVTSGQRVTYRAVDRAGNISAAYSLAAP